MSPQDIEREVIRAREAVAGNIAIGSNGQTALREALSVAQGMMQSIALWSINYGNGDLEPRIDDLDDDGDLLAATLSGVADLVTEEQAHQAAEALVHHARAAIDRASERAVVGGMAPTSRVMELRILDGRIAQTKEFINTVSAAEKLVERSLEAVRTSSEAAQTSEKAAKSAAALAGKTGDEELSSFFKTTAQKESVVAGWWTAVAIITTLLGAAAGYLLHLWGGLSEPASLIYPVVVALSLIGLGTYFARLAGHHRHSALWARSISVQLDSYAKFVQQTSPDARVAVFDRFASRVLGAPPPRSPRAADPAATNSLTVAEVIALMSKQAS